MSLPTRRSPRCPAQVAAQLWAYFAERVEAYRDADGVRLDVELAGLVAGV